LYTKINYFYYLERDEKADEAFPGERRPEARSHRRRLDLDVLRHLRTHSVSRQPTLRVLLLACSTKLGAQNAAR